ncbi:MAG TPA: GspE/PulE family protein [Deferrisomatales bacterium]|nr:GspE/PulE family protein [Deferrisomatales bacterium]
MSAVENLALRRRRVPGSGNRLTFQHVVDACLAGDLLDAATARFLGERQPRQEALYRRRHGDGTPVDPVQLLLDAEVTAPGAETPLQIDPVLDALAAHIGTPRAHIDPVRLDADAIVRALPRAFARKHAVLVLDPKASPVPVAAADPFDVAALDTVRQRLGREVVVQLASRSELLHLIHEIYGFKTSVAAAERDLNQLPDLQNLEQFFRMRPEGEVDSSDGHIVRAVDHLLRYALDQRASDIHIEPKREQSVVRLRIDGVLHTVHTFSRRVHKALVSRLKTLSRMNIAEKRLPQDGRIKTEYNDKAVELRVSTLPVAYGEKVVMRIFDPTVLALDLPDLGLLGDDLAAVEGFLARPHGILLVTGPTGSGKTTSLYAALKRLATGERNISTVEDPIENICDEFNQVGVQSQIGLTFATALRTLLRQDPDVIMVGEIRDAETAKMAVQAALTGHLVLSTVHTNDAAGAVGRLLDMGVEPYLLASSLLGIVAQRLVRSPCPHCAAEAVGDPGELEALGLAADTLAMEGVGCPRCRRTGYLGRTGLYEILVVTPEVGEAIYQTRPTRHLRQLARSQGMRTLREAGADTVREGRSTPREVLAVTPPDEDPGHDICKNAGTNIQALG